MGYFNTYGIQYRGEFDSIPMNGTSDRYFFNISKKGADENIQSVLCAGTPAVHSYLNDEPKTYIKGSELEITLLNVDNNLPLNTFYSEEDDTWKIDFYVVIDSGLGPTNNQLLFSGYLTQENCTEVLIDVTHEINLVFTDNLGFLKEINFEDALLQTPNRLYPIEVTENTYIKTLTDNNGVKYFQVQFDNLLNWNNGAPIQGDVIQISNCVNGNGYYTVTSCTQVGTSLPLTWDIYVEQEMPDITVSASQNPWFPYLPSGTQATISILKPYKRTDTVALIDIYWILLYNTGIQLDFFFANMLQESSDSTPVDPKRILEYVYISLDTFFENDTSDSLDNIAEKLGYRFSSSLFQSLGKWNLVRWNELRNTQEITPNPSTLNKLNADWYRKQDFDWLDRIPITKVRNIGNGQDIESGVEGSIFRPLKSVEHCYKYSQNEDIPFNNDFKKTGKLINQYTTGTGSDLKYIKEYEAIGWTAVVPATNIFPPQYITRFIRVVYNNFGNEEDRYIVIVKPDANTDYRFSVCSNYPIQMSKGDTIEISFDIRAASPHNGNGSSYTAMPCLTTDPLDATKYWNIGDYDGNWVNVIGNGVQIYINSGWEEWRTVSVKSKAVPVDGIAYILLPQLFHPNETQTYIKNLEIKYTTYLGNSNGNQGHCHKTIKSGIIKNSEKEDIYVDDTQKNYSKGTLFLSTFTDSVRNRTKIWFDGAGLSAVLGEIITRQENLWRNKSRLKLEGNLFPITINQGTTDVQVLSMLSVVDFLIQPTKHLIFGKLELDYKMNQSKFTAYEMWKDGEIYWINTGTQIVEVGANSDKDIKYTFKYIQE